ncbi:MAG: nitrite/sulfite reductase [Sarcina sp.]
MEHLKNTLLEEIENYRELGNKFLNKEINVPNFKKLSGAMGSYGQRGASDFMVRLRVPSGVCSKKDFRFLSDIAKDSNLDNIHLTTRQAIQFHSITIDQVCNIMTQGIEHGLYSRGSGGNFPRNVAISPLSGVDKEDVFDVTPYALALNNYFLNQITSYKLPRKLKVSFSSSPKDEAHCTVSDLGFVARSENGEEFFEVYAGGGLGRNPQKAIKVIDRIEKNEVINYVEAMVSMFEVEGDWNNHGKARIRYMLARMGNEAFIECFNRHLTKVKNISKSTLDVKEMPITKVGNKTETKHMRLIEQKQEGLYSVYFHPIAGILKLEDLDAILDATQNMEAVEFRTTMNEGMYIRNLNGEEADKILALTMNKGGETIAEQSVSCIGATICQIGVLDSHSLLVKLVDEFKANNLENHVLPRIHISGCPNSCGVHEIGSIGLVGKKKRVGDAPENVFELHFGGHVSLASTELAKVVADILETQVPSLLVEIGLAVQNSGMTFEEWIASDNAQNFTTIVNKYSV